MLKLDVGKSLGLLSLKRKCLLFTGCCFVAVLLSHIPVAALLGAFSPCEVKLSCSHLALSFTLQLLELVYILDGAAHSLTKFFLESLTATAELRRSFQSEQALLLFTCLGAVSFLVGLKDFLHQGLGLVLTHKLLESLTPSFGSRYSFSVSRNSLLGGKCSKLTNEILLRLCRSFNLFTLGECHDTARCHLFRLLFTLTHCGVSKHTFWDRRSLKTAKHLFLDRRLRDVLRQDVCVADTGVKCLLFLHQC